MAYILSFLTEIFSQPAFLMGIISRWGYWHYGHRSINY